MTENIDPRTGELVTEKSSNDDDITVAASEQLNQTPSDSTKFLRLGIVQQV